MLLIRVRDDGKLLHSLLGKPASGRVSGASGPCPLTFTSNAHAMAYSARISGFLLPAGCPKIRLLPCSSQHDRGRQALCNNRFSVGGDKELGSQPTAFHARQHRKIENPGVPTRPPKKSALQVNAVAVPLGCGHLAPLERRPVVCSLAQDRTSLLRNDRRLKPGHSDRLASTRSPQTPIPYGHRRQRQPTHVSKRREPGTAKLS